MIFPAKIIIASPLKIVTFDERRDVKTGMPAFASCASKVLAMELVRDYACQQCLIVGTHIMWHNYVIYSQKCETSYFLGAKNTLFLPALFHCHTSPLIFLFNISLQNILLYISEVM